MNSVKYYDFLVDGLDNATFTVASFTGSESMSALYRFKILLVAKKALDGDTLSKIVNAPARLVFLDDAAENKKKKQKEDKEKKDKKSEFRDEVDFSGFQGIISRFDYLQQKQQNNQSFYFYRAILVPQAWRMTQNQSSRIFLDKDTPSILGEVLQQGGLKPNTDYKINAHASEDAWDYVCMFNESPFDFISHRMERNGFYYFFDQTDSGEVMRIVDDKSVHAPKPGSATLEFLASFKPSEKGAAETVYSFQLRQNAMPGKVLVRDYNYLKANVSIQAEEIVDDDGTGEVYCYGENLRSKDEAKAIAKVRKQEILCRKRVFYGASNAWSMHPGSTFNLDKDPFSELNTSDNLHVLRNERLQKNALPEVHNSYLITEVEHQGQQSGYLHSLLGINMGNVKNEPVYKNSFVCIESQVQFRPQRTTQKNRFHGLLSATIDGSVESGKPSLDEQGRYKVIMPFDTSGRKDGKASCWLRLMHPFAGKDVGFHFPLLKGTEAMVSFIDGDPDRPVITGAVHNSESPSIVTSKNSHLNAMQTRSKQVFWISDKTDDEHILCGTVDKQSKILVESAEKGDFASKTSLAGNEYKFMFGNYGRAIVGNKVDTIVGTKTGIDIAPEYKIAYGPKYDVRLNFSKSLRQKFYGFGRFSPVAFTPLNVKFNRNDSFEWGDGSTFHAKESKTLLGQEKASIYGGATVTVSKILKKAAVTIGLGMTVAVGGSLGIAIGQAISAKNLKTTQQTDAGDNLTRNLAFAGTSALPTTIAAMAMNKFLGKFHTLAKTAVEKEYRIGGMIKCDAHGIIMQANTQTELPSAQVKICTRKNVPAVGSAVAADESSIVLGPNGKSIEISRGSTSTTPPATQTCNIKMENDKFTLKSAKLPDDAQLITEPKKMQLKVNSGSGASLMLSPTKNALELGSDNQIKQLGHCIFLQKTKTKLVLSSGSAALSSGSNKLTVTSAKVDLGGGSAMVHLKGSMVNIG